MFLHQFFCYYVVRDDQKLRLSRDKSKLLGVKIINAVPKMFINGSLFEVVNSRTESTDSHMNYRHANRVSAVEVNKLTVVRTFYPLQVENVRVSMRTYVGFCLFFLKTWNQDGTQGCFSRCEMCINLICLWFIFNYIKTRAAAYLYYCSRHYWILYIIRTKYQKV